MASKNIPIKKNLLWIGVALAALFWMIESAIDAYIFHEGSYLQRLIDPDPNEIWMRIVIASILIAFARFAQAVYNADINRKLAATVFENATEAILVTDTKANILMVNAAFTRITGYSASEALGKNPRIFQSGRHHKTFYNEMWRALIDTGHWEGEIWDRKKSGEIFPKWLSITSVQDTFGDVTQYTGLFTDITQRKAQEEKLNFRANYDLLTGLANRQLFSKRLSQALKKSTKNHRKTAVFFVDLDHFKQVNDTFGHLNGDEILKMAADRLDSCIRGNDTLARVGGDEFLIVLPDILERLEAVIVAERIIEKFSRPFRLDGQNAVLGTSIGIAIAPEDSEEIAGLIKHADTAMYRSKSLGGNRFLFFDQMENPSDSTCQTIKTKKQQARADTSVET